jgi:2-phosphoglycerate kinase
VILIYHCGAAKRQPVGRHYATARFPYDTGMMNQITHGPAWKVLLLGGHSGVGKTVVARHLARHYGVGLAEVDDFRLVLQRITTPEQHPNLHFFLNTDIIHWTVDDLRDHLIAVNQIVCSALEIVVANHVATNTSCILEVEVSAVNSTI